MAIKKSDRFIKTGVNLCLNTSDFPPEKFDYEGISMNILGGSNKDDLIPTNIDASSPEILKAVTFGAVKQFICTSNSGNLYDACFYKDEAGRIFLYGIRTRQVPDKPKKSRKKEEGDVINNAV